MQFKKKKEKKKSTWLEVRKHEFQPQLGKFPRLPLANRFLWVLVLSCDGCTGSSPRLLPPGFHDSISLKKVIFSP